MAKTETTETTAQKLLRLKQEVELLEKQDKEEKNAKIITLPESLGFGGGVDGMVALVTALLPYTEGKLKIGKTKGAKTGGGKRMTITPELTAAIIADLKLGTMSAAKLKEKHGPSTATINSIKKKAGLIKTK